MKITLRGSCLNVPIGLMFIFIIYLYFCIDVMSYVCDIMVFGILFDDFFTLQIIFFHGKRATCKIYIPSQTAGLQPIPRREDSIITIPGLVLVVSVWDQ